MHSSRDEHIAIGIALLKKQSPVFRDHALAGFRLGRVGTPNHAKGRRLRENLTGVPLLMWPVDSVAASINTVITHHHRDGCALLVGVVEAALNLLDISTDWPGRAAL